jgi:uncharacterized peroxidase-related enzyme
MRLAILESGHDRVSGLALWLMSRFSRDDVTDILKVVFYRTQFFGTPFSDLVHDALRGPSFWSVGERELFASFTSHTNDCPFCTAVHRDFAASYAGERFVDDALASPTTAGLRPEARAVLGFLDKMSREPHSLTAADVAAVRAEGVDDEALDEAVHISTLFHVISRIMNAVGATVPNRRQRAESVRFIRRFGYRIPAPVRLLSHDRRSRVTSGEVVSAEVRSGHRSERLGTRKTHRG